MRIIYMLALYASGKNVRLRLEIMSMPILHKAQQTKTILSHHFVSKLFLKWLGQDRHKRPRKENVPPTFFLKTTH